jgi:murein L,D-transpeptidase YafK
VHESLVAANAFAIINLNMRLFALAIGLSVLCSAAQATPAGRWVRVDTQAQTIAVMNGAEVLTEFDNVAFGRGGVGFKRTRGDGRTPLGEYRIHKINHESSYDIFLGLDYPSIQDAERGLKAGIIDMKTYGRIRDALRAGHTPPQDTPLGGQIGIHGVGAGSLKIHNAYNWTRGCIAVPNRDIRKLTSLVNLGTPVVIQDGAPAPAKAQPDSATLPTPATNTRLARRPAPAPTPARATVN